MSTRILTSRSYRAANTSYVKVLFGAVIALVLLMILVPLMLNHKPKGSVKKPSGDRTMVVAGVPKPAVPAVPQSEHSIPAVNESMLRGNKDKVGIVDVPQPAQEKAVQQEPQEKAKVMASIDKSSLPVATSMSAKPLIQADKPAKAVVVSAGNAALDAPKAKSVAGTEHKENKPAVVASLKPAAKPKDAPAALSPAKEEKSKELTKSIPASGALKYIVQVGSFRNKQNAESLQESLKRKGYPAVIKPFVHQKLGQIYFVQTTPTDNMDKAATLKSSIEREGNMTPIVLKVGPK